MASSTRLRSFSAFSSHCLFSSSKCSADSWLLGFIRTMRAAFTTCGTKPAAYKFTHVQSNNKTEVIIIWQCLSITWVSLNTYKQQHATPFLTDSYRDMQILVKPWIIIIINYSEQHGHKMQDYTNDDKYYDKIIFMSKNLIILSRHILYFTIFSSAIEKPTQTATLLPFVL